MKNIKKKMKRLFYLRVAVLMTFFLGLCLAFSPLQVQAARLFGVTGDGASQRETLFMLDQGNASSTFVMSLGNGSGGETIAFNPVDGLLYHWSGIGDQNDDINGEIFEKINPITLEITPITLSGDNYTEALAATYNPFPLDPLTDEFLVADANNFVISVLYRLTAGGVVSRIGPMNHLSKGLAFFEGELYSIQQSWNDVPSLFKINPTDGSTIPFSEVELSLPGFTLKGANGLATNPDDGVLWALLKAKPASGPAERLLVTINPSDGVATPKGSTGDKFAGIAFDNFKEFSTFTLKKTMVKFRHKLNNDEIVVDDRFVVKGKFVLGEGNVINPVDDGVIVKVGTSTIEIQPGLFGEHPDGTFRFMGTIDGAHVRMKIRWIYDNTFKFEIMAEGVDLTGTPNPVLVGLAVGNDIAQSSIRLKGELSKHKHKH